MRRVQTASLVLAYSRMLFFQFYPRFRRFVNARPKRQLKATPRELFATERRCRPAPTIARRFFSRPAPSSWASLVESSAGPP